MTTTAPSSDHGPALSPPAPVAVLSRVAPFRVYLVFTLLLVASVAWRKGAYFSGGVDGVVVAKAALTSLAFVVALLDRRPPRAWSTLRGAPVLYLVAYLAVATVGGLLTGDPLPSLVLAARVALLAATLVLVVLAHPWQVVVSAMAGSMLALATVGAVTGIGSIAETGRLYGGIPPLNANEICFLVSVPLVVIFWRCVAEHARWFEYVALPLLVGVVWLTGARTGLAALVLAMLVVVALTPRVPEFIAALCATAIPFVLYLTFFTDALSSFAGRGGVSSVITLNSRTIAWRSALDYHDSVVGQLLGGGLSLKQVPVSAMYRSEQILDSTWFSAILQSGYVGLALLLLLLLSTLAAAFRRSAPGGALTVALIVMVTTVSVLESGMFDTTPAFILFFTLALLVHRLPHPMARPDSETVASRP
ncbi:hypothetical protein GCM10023339_09360 [Alloalcanivorax gelatiniphagus]